MNYLNITSISHSLEEGFCKNIDTSCAKHNICRTCSTFSSKGGTCSEVSIHVSRLCIYVFLSTSHINNSHVTYIIYFLD